MNRNLFLQPDWSVPAHVLAGTTCRQGGVSQPPYASLNLAQHVGDDPAAVAENRARLGLPAEPGWLQQVHSNRVIRLEGRTDQLPEADASYTREANVTCAVLTAD